MKIHLTILFLLCATMLLAQQPFEVWETRTVESASLGESRTIQVYLPEDYEESVMSYPTLYILDGQWYFLNGVGLMKTLRGENLLPKMIVVGVIMDKPNRAEIFGDKWDAFIEFMEEELVPYVDVNFRTTNDRVLFGWENSAFLACELLLREEGAFSATIATNGAEINEEALSALTKERYLFLANSTKDIYSISYTDQAVEVLERAAPENLTWEYQAFNEEIHQSLAYPALLEGLKFYYHNYGSLVFGSIDEFYEKGGIEYLETYFAERGERWGLPTEISASTKNSLIWLAWKQDRFEAFSLFMEEFSDVLSTPRYASAYWQNRLAQFYLKYEDYDNAIKFFKQGVEKYPDEKLLPQLYEGLGKAYEGKGDKNEAKRWMKMVEESN